MFIALASLINYMFIALASLINYMFIALASTALPICTGACLLFIAAIIA